jgi:oligo-1,6-glucosidase
MGGRLLCERVSGSKLLPPYDIKYCVRPRVHEFIREMNREALASQPLFLSTTCPAGSASVAESDIFTVGEAPFSRAADELAEYVLPDNHELQMVFQFEVRSLTRYSKRNPR